MVTGRTTVTVSMVNYPDLDVYEVDSETDVFISGAGVLNIVHARGVMGEPVESHHIAPHAWTTIDIVVNQKPVRHPTPRGPQPGRENERGNSPRKHRRWFK